MNFFQRIAVLVALLIIASCSDSNDDTPAPDNPTNSTSNDWIIPLNEVTGSDTPFPFAENPAMLPVNEIDGLSDTDQVVLVSFKETVKAYPLKFIAPFEVINDQLDGVSYAISYCPVTESVLCTENKQSSSNLSLVASGYRQNQNLIVKDINSNSYWTQMLITYVKGPYTKQNPKTLPMLETNWDMVKMYFPEALVFASNSISSKESPVKKTTDFGTDERVYGILNESEINDTSVFMIGFSNFDTSIKSYNQIIGTNQVYVFGSQQFNFITAFNTSITNSLTPVQNKFPVIMKDASGLEYNVFGIPVSDSNQEIQLEAPRSYLASWWAWQEFYRTFHDL